MRYLESSREQSRAGENPTLQAKFQGPYTVVRSWANHTYKIERQGQVSIQNKCRLKAYRPRPEEIGRAPVTLEPTQRPNMRGAIRRRKRTPSPDTWVQPLWLLPPPPQSAGELPLPGIERQADPVPCPAQREDITGQTTERELALLDPE